MMPAHDVFVSYSHPDKDCAMAIVAALEARGIGVWVAPRDISPAADWATEIVDAIARARLMVLILSVHSNDSPQVRREVERAVHRQIPVLPFRIEEVLPSKSLEYFLSTQHWLDAFPGAREPYLQRLVAHCEQLFDRGAQPDFPQPAQRAQEFSLDSAQRQLLERQLALYVGPIAPILIKRAIPLARRWQDLIDVLAAEVKSERARQLFVTACGSGSAK
jgi:hypothetical protein